MLFIYFYLILVLFKDGLTEFQLIGIESCGDKFINTLVKENLTLSIVEETFVVNGWIELTENVDNNLWHFTEVFLNNGLHITITGEFCEHIHEVVPSLWNEIVNRTQLPNTCPIPVGIYKFQEVDVASLPSYDLPFLYEGEMKILFKLFKDLDLVHCNKFILLSNNSISVD